MPLFFKVLFKIKRIIDFLTYRYSNIEIYVTNADGIRKRVKRVKGLNIHNYGKNNIAEIELPVNFINSN